MAEARQGTDRPSTAELASRARAGDQQAWNEIVDRFAPLVWSTCRRFRLSPADADDACQGTWLRLVENLEELRRDAALPGWIATIAYRECLHVAKAGRDRDRRHGLFDEASSASDPLPPPADEQLILHQRNDALRASFGLLSERCRQLLALLVHDPPLSYREIGERLGVPVGGLGPTRARCLDKLRRSEPLAPYLATAPEQRKGGSRERRPVADR